MQKTLRTMLKEIFVSRARHRKLVALVCVLSVLVVAGVFWRLTQPAITMAADPVCGMSEHSHTPACQASKLVCGTEEGESHTHASACFETVMVCGEKEHSHGDGCYPREMAEPSIAPTAVPTAEPTPAPTATAEAAVIAEEEPTAAPTNEPTATAEPTAAPDATAEPTISPEASIAPSVSPEASAEASIAPSVSPEASAEASIAPSVSPEASAEASIAPSVSPEASAEASIAPSVSPEASAEESIAPSVSPEVSVEPSAEPLPGMPVIAISAAQDAILAGETAVWNYEITDAVNAVYTNEVAARTAVGRGHRPLRLYVSPMRNDGKVVGALAMVEDITEIRRLEQVRTDFAANVSHELKTPLTSIRGFVETLQEGAIDNPPMAHKFLRIIMMETERLTRLINDILSISKLESGDTEVSTERLRLDKMAYDVADMLSIHASEKEISINCHMNHEPVNIIGNPDRVEQMLINLIENGIKYNKPGGSVTVQVFSNGEEANVTISDTGIGIAEENLPRLFERFYRVDKGRSRQMGGTGLGLAIVKHIVRSMGGEIEVHSKLNEGTEFLITLPLAAANGNESDNIFGDDE